MVEIFLIFSPKTKKDYFLHKMEKIRREYEDIIMTGMIKEAYSYPCLFLKKISPILIELLTAILHALHYGIH